MSATAWEKPDFRKDTGMSRYTVLADRHEWSVKDLPFDDLPPVPEKKSGNSEKRTRMWQSVVSRQLQADMRAVEMATHLFKLAEHQDAKEYYITMVDDEATHTKAWLKLMREINGDLEINPYMENLSDRVMAADLVAADFMMQGVFERGIIPKFKIIAGASEGTVLAEICKRLLIDDTIHHRSGVTYLEALLPELSPERKLKIAREAAKALPDFIQFATWHPRGMGPENQRSADANMSWAISEVQRGADLGVRLGLPFDKVELELPPGATVRIRPSTQAA